MQLNNQVAIVTGAGNGIGKAIAERFSAEGAKVVVNDINAETAQSVVDALNAAGGNAIAAVADVSDKAQVDAMIDATLDAFGTVDILVNNAGIVQPTLHMFDADETWWRRIIDVNLTGVFLCSHRAARIMAKKGSGCIINMSSGGASRAHRGFTSYDAAKGGVEALTRAMALDLGPYGVRVNTVVPGSINTRDMDAATKKYRGENIPLGRVGESHELAGPCVFLASNDASYITGHIITVDGGMLAQQRSATVDIFGLDRFPSRGQL